MEFKAKVKMPKRELWVGAIIEDIDSRISASGMGYSVIRFANCPFFASWSEVTQYLYNRSTGRNERDESLPFSVGDTVSLDVGWIRRESHGIYANPRLVLENFSG